MMPEKCIKRVKIVFFHALHFNVMLSRSGFQLANKSYFLFLYFTKNICLVLDALAFERLLGPCMDIMKRNEETYKEMLANAFNRKVKTLL